MIHFFRRIRRGLINQDRVGKYLLYAIGEILLVVFGILIALYINNANTKSQTEKEIISLFEKSLDELEQNIDRCNYVINLFRLRDSIYHLTMQDKITYEDYVLKRIPINWNVDMNTVDLDHNTILQLLNRENDIPFEFEEVFRSLKHLHNTRKTDINHFEKELIDVIKLNRESHNKYKWFPMYTEEEKQAYIEYLLNSDEHRIFAAEYKHSAVDGLAKFSLYYRRSAIQIYYELGELLESSNLNMDFNLAQNYSWMNGQWTSSEDLDHEITYEAKQFDVIGGKLSGWSNTFFDAGEWQLNMYILGLDNFGIKTKSNYAMTFTRMTKINDDLFHMVSNKGDTITYNRVFD